jgi:hypothetical protein
MQAEAEKPKDEQDYKYCPEHGEFPFQKNTRKDELRSFRVFVFQ